MITETNKIDFVGIDNDDSTKLVVGLTDHLPWNKKNEYEHLMLLQEKINSYISYIQNAQYKEIFKNEINGFCINIFFANTPTKNCISFISSANEGLSIMNIKITYEIVEN